MEPLVILLVAVVLVLPLLHAIARYLPEPFASLVKAVYPALDDMARAKLLSTLAEEAVLEAEDFKQSELAAGREFSGQDALQRAINTVMAHPSVTFNYEQARVACRAAYQRLFNQEINLPEPY